MISHACPILVRESAYEGVEHGEGGFVVASMEGKPKAPPLVERFVRQLVVVNKAVMMYPPSSEIPGTAAAACIEVLHELLREVPEVRISVAKTGLLYEQIPIFPGTKGFSDFSHELYIRKLAEVRFHAGIQARDLVSFLSILKYTPDEIDAGGGVEARLWELGVSTVTVRELRVTLIETQLSSSDSDGEIAQRHGRDR